MIDMGDKIEFPFNDQMYFEQAVEYIERNDFEAALACIKKVYENDKGTAVNHLYTLILYTLERYDEALDIANEQKNFYVAQEKHATLYTMLLIKNQLFLEAEVLIQDHLTESPSFYSSEWESLERELELERELVNFEMEMEKQATKKELAELDSYSPNKQTEIIQKARTLELEDLQERAAFIFSSPSLSGIAQRAFLELLVEKQDTDQYLFPWFNQQKEVVPREIERFDQVTIIQNLDDILSRKLHKYPSLFEVVKVEMMNDLLLLYPFIEEVVTDIDYWVESYIEYFDFSEQLQLETTPQTNEHLEMEKWLSHLHQVARRNLKTK